MIDSCEGLFVSSKLDVGADSPQSTVSAPWLALFLADASGWRRPRSLLPLLMCAQAYWVRTAPYRLAAVTSLGLFLNTVLLGIRAPACGLWGDTVQSIVWGVSWLSASQEPRVGARSLLLQKTFMMPLSRCFIPQSHLYLGSRGLSSSSATACVALLPKDISRFPPGSGRHVDLGSRQLPMLSLGLVLLLPFQEFPSPTPPPLYVACSQLLWPH